MSVSSSLGSSIGSSLDPFDVAGGDSESVVSPNDVHIRIQQRTGRKTLTTISGLPKDLDFNRLIKTFKKLFSCNGALINSEELGTVVQLQGDQRKNALEFLVKEKIVKKSQIKIHGF